MKNMSAQTPKGSLNTSKGTKPGFARTLLSCLLSLSMISSSVPVEALAAATGSAASTLDTQETSLQNAIDSGAVTVSGDGVVVNDDGTVVVGDAPQQDAAAAQPSDPAVQAQPELAPATGQAAQRHVLQQSFTAADGNTWQVELSYADDAAIPANAQLKVVQSVATPQDLRTHPELYKNRPQEYERFVAPAVLAEQQAALDRMLGVGESDYRFYADFLKLTIVADGREVTPQAEVEVSITTSAVAPEDSDAIEAVLLTKKGATLVGSAAGAKAIATSKWQRELALAKMQPSDYYRALDVHNATGDYVYDEQGNLRAVEEGARRTSLRLTLSELGEIALAGVVTPLHVRQEGEASVELMGPRHGFELEALDAGVPAYDEGDVFVDGFAVQARLTDEAAVARAEQAMARNREALAAAGLDQSRAVEPGCDLSYGVNAWARVRQAGEGSLTLWTCADDAYQRKMRSAEVGGADAFRVDRETLALFWHEQPAQAPPAPQPEPADEATGAEALQRDLDAAEGAANESEDELPSEQELLADALAEALDPEQQVQAEPAQMLAFPAYTMAETWAQQDARLMVASTAEDDKDGAGQVGVQITAIPSWTVPSNAKPQLRELSGEEAAPYLERAREQVGGAAGYLRAFDIALVGPAGTEYEPSVPVEVSLSSADVPAVQGLQVVHFARDGAEVLPSHVDGETVTFATGGFSVFVLVGYTVDFHWGEYTYSINGEDSILLGELFEKLGVEDITVADVESVSFSNSELVKVDKTEDGTDWRLTSLKPFSSEEKLTLDLKNGQSIDIRVTDEEATPVTWPDNMVDIHLKSFNGNLATYEIIVNPNADTLTSEGQSYILKDTFSDNQSIIYDSIKVFATQGTNNQGSSEGVTYDYSERTGTYSIPDGYKVTITYTTRVSGAVETDVSFANTAVVGRMNDGTFVAGQSKTVAETKTITPTGTDISGSGGVYSINLFVYANGHMEQGLDGAVFRLLDSNMRPMTYKAGEHSGEEIRFTTGANGAAVIALNEATDGLSLHKNTVYFLEMLEAPCAVVDGKTVFYQKDDTYYSFLITDDPSYHYGEIYSYFNGDTLKVRCYPEGKGINVTKRFSGNYALTEDQKKAITFTLQKEKQYSPDGWENIETHNYGEFSYGSINFRSGSEAGTPLENNATYRVIETNNLPADLKDKIEGKSSVVVSYQNNGVRVTGDDGEFYVDPEAKDAFSYDYVFTNEYVDHKLTLININENTGETLSGGVFTVYAADDNNAPIATYTASDGSITIRRSDNNAEYSANTLYYVLQTKEPSGYVLQDDPEKVYFYFSDNGSGIPDGLPSGEMATDLTTSYNTVTIANDSEQVSVPVTVVWGVKGNEAWPDAVKKVTVGLYKSVDGGAPAQVLDSSNQPWTLDLTKDKSYDSATFVNLPALEEKENGKRITYSVVEEHVYGANDVDITTQFAHSSSVSGTDWHVVKNEPAVSVTIKKKWLDQNGNVISNTAGKAPVTFNLYRTTREMPNTSFTRAELAAFFLTAEAELVRPNVQISADGWSTTIESLPKTDSDEHPYYYYALETPVLDNQEDSYEVEAATGSSSRTLTIANKQTPFTVTIKVNDAEKTYGGSDPAYDFAGSDVKEDGASLTISGPDGSGTYTATVTAANHETKNIMFSVARVSGEDAGTYTVTPSGDALQSGYRVLYEPGTLTIKRAEVTVTAGATKVYGAEDPDLVQVEGLIGNDTISYAVSREEGEDVGEYPITLTGDEVQGNYHVTYDRTNAKLTITPALATVTANPATKVYGADDPELTATVTGLQRGDAASVLEYDLTRAPGEDVGEYAITPAGEATQGNYTVTYVPDTFTITAAALTVKAKDAEKGYGEDDPEWEIEISGLAHAEEGGALASTLDEQTGVRTYTYTVGAGGTAKTLLTFTVSRVAGENVGNYALTATGEALQGNYTLTFEDGSTLSIVPAELTVTADHVVKAVGVVDDPLLTATVVGWQNGDDPLEDTELVSTETNGNTITRTYKRGTGAAEVVFTVISGIAEDKTVTWTYKRGETQLLTFTLKRDPGEEEGDYQITASGESPQSNYTVNYEPDTFSILSVLDIDVKQPVVDDADANATPSYTYTAKLDLAGTGLDEYAKNDFEMVEGVPTRTFMLPSNGAGVMTLKVPGGAKLTVEQTSNNPDYTTALSIDGNPYTDPNNAALCILEHVDTYHEMAFTHSRISYPVEARVSETQSEEGASKLDGRKGAMGIPTGDELTREINVDFADDMHSKIGYVLPTDKYYMYDHASLYTTAGVAIEGASNVSAIKYDRENNKWQYKVGEGDFTDAPEDSQLVLFYLPKFVCKIGTKKFYSLKAAVDYVKERIPGKTATIEMLIGEYSVRSTNDAVTIPEGYDITITTASTEYEGTGTAVISRSASYPAGHLFYNDGSLTFDNIILDGKNVQATDALVLNRDNEPNLTVNADATLRNARGNNGGAIYVKSGIVTVNGTLSGNTATSGGAIYVNSGTFKLGSTGSITGCSATSGGAIYVNDGTVEINGTVSASTATNGGAVYLTKGSLTVAGALTENAAASGGAVYQASGTLTVSGSMSGNTASSNGGAVYQNGGTITVEATGSLSGNSATENGGAIYLAGGTLTNEGTIGGAEDGAGNRAANGGGIYRAGGTLTLNGTVSGNTASGNGGGIHTTGGTLNVDATISGNTAVSGGAIYVSGATLNLKGGSLSENAATDGNGGAIYALNSSTVIGGKTVNNVATAGSKVTAVDNKASKNGGAVYMEGGSLTVLAASKLTGNEAQESGGAIYATSGAITLTSGRLSGNTASSNGGAVYAASASVTVNGATVSSNTATQNNGGAIYAGSGTVTVSGGTISANTATQGNGGAIYADLGTVNFTGGNINGGNSAVNGAAIYVGSGIANVSASITGNTATNGGAIGVGGTGARLNFSGNAEVNNNTMNGAQSNVYLDVDSELVINANSLNAGKTIGVYVPGEVDSDQVVKHGDVTGYFGAYVSAGTLANIPKVFKSDRFSDLEVAYENNRMYWISNLSYDIYYLKDYTSQFPPTSRYTASPSKKVCSRKTYAPRTRQSDIYDLVMAMKLYEAHDGDFTSNVGSNYASTAVYAYTFSDKAMSGFTDYLKSVEWDAVARKWKYTSQSGTEITNTSKLVIFYSAPAYLTIVNNNTSGLELDISELTVLNQNAAQGLYGFVTAKNGATVTTLRTITEDDMKLAAGDSIKLMLPGAQGQRFTIRGEFVGSGEGEIKYTFNGGAEQTISGTTVDLSSYNLNTNDVAAELVFGDALPICKIGNEPFSTLKAAMAYAVAQKAATGSNTYKIEMLVDYLVPEDDVLEIPEGYNITFTTADPDAETLPFTGNGTRATLSRDTGNKDSSVRSTKSTLTVNNLAFDGRSLTAGGKGGAVSATNCTTVTITDCEFKGYRADNGGAVYVENKNAGSRLTVEDCDFYNCQTNASVDKAGGGGIWTTARELYVRDCTFDSCACLKGSAQAGSVFHNIQANWFTDSKTVISDCTFSNSYAVGGSGGTVESDAYDVTIERCSFEGSYTNKSGGSGGAINTYANNEASTSKYCIMRVIDCTFDNCSAKNGAAMGGAVRCSTHDLILRGCVFRNTQGVTGGAVAMTNSNAKKVEIYGCVFDNCTATGNGGAVSAPVGTLIVGVEDTGAEDYRSTYLDNTEKDNYNHFTDCAANRGGGIDNAKNDASVTMENVRFTRCAARTNGGGALYTQAKTLSIIGEDNTFTDCTGWGSGGAVYQNRNVDGSTVDLKNCVFTGCEAFNKGNGGGMYSNAKALTISGDENGFTNCTAANMGGGLYQDYEGTVTIENCGFDHCTALADVGGGLRSKAQTLTITGAKSVFKDCTAQTSGGGLYHDRDAANSEFTFRDGSFDNCTAMGSNGGAIYTKVKGTVTLKDCTIKDSTAKAQGGGICFGNGNTASFDGCTITGNSVTNNDSKGGGVYVSSGTTTFINSTVSGCEAANGGGWYQNNGNLYILGGSISGSAVYGGGLYMFDSNTRVYQYGGAVGGTATANGGGVYKANGGYTLGNGTYNEIEYTDGASIGGRITLPVIVNGEETTETVDSSAVNGGGVYQAGGSFTMNAGASIGSVETGENGEIVYTATATGNGGGIYIGGSWVKIFGGVITNCQADGNGGGIYLASTGSSNDLFFYGDADTKIQNCSATNGGGVYVYSNTFQFGENGKTSFGAIENCRATGNGGGVYQEGGTFNHRNTSEIIDCTADNDGGGVYQAGGTFNQNDTSSIAGCSASNNGGGVYHAGGTFTFSGGSIIQNGATVNGGGVHHAGGAFSMTNAGAVIGGSEENANTANVGAGVFVADGQAATFNGSTVTYNHALTAGGGIAVGGPDAALTFQNAATVRNNTMGSQNTECNVYLDQDRNTIINNNALNANAYIGVYASDDQDAGHGVQGMPFATWNTGNNNDKNLNVYHNDRRPYLYGMKGSTNNEVIWPKFVCKITDGGGKLLYLDANGTPAVYSELENIGASGAFSALNTEATPALYSLNEDGSYSLYTDDEGDGYQVQMLVEEYELASGRQIKLDQAAKRKITLTTASTTEDECGFYYTGDARFNATIKRTAVANTMVFVGGINKWEITLSNITLDGGEQAATQEGAILRIENKGTVILDDGATLQKGLTANKAGGAVYLKDSGCAFTMNAGSQIKDCSAGTSNGGAVAVNNGTFTMNGGEISGCSAANGGGIYMNNSSKMYMNGGTITGNSATSTGGGISHNKDKEVKVYFSGYCTVTGNTLNSTTRCNVQLNRDTNAIINASGLDSRSEIGIYTDGVETNTGSIYFKHGMSSKPFGTWSVENDNLFCFINDRSTNLRGFQSAIASEKKIIWEYHPLLTVTKAVSSDLSADQDKLFTFTVKLPGTTLPTQSERNSITGMSFSSQGEATVTLKAGESKTAVFPDDFHLKSYEVMEELPADMAEDYTATAEKDGTAYPFTEEKPLTVIGKLGENIGTENSTSLSEVVFTNTRATGDLTVSKQVISEIETDKAESFEFKATLKDTGISKSFDTTKIDAEHNKTVGTLTFTAGVSDAFCLKDGESLTIEGLPTDLEYTVEEILTDAQKAHIRTQVSKDGSEAVYAVEQDGTIGEKSATETVEGVEKTVYASEVAFTNNFLEIVCKITNRSRALLYYRDAANRLQPAIYSHLEDAFEQVNSGNLRTALNGSVSGVLRIEMVVPAYTMSHQATLNSGKTVILSTAQPTDEDYPYNKGIDDRSGNVSTVSRGFVPGSMIVDKGSLTIDRITLDGASKADEPITAVTNGGIIQVDGAVRLTVNDAATLQNSKVEGENGIPLANGNGGAIYLGNGASLSMNGTIRDCSAANGGGVYADTGAITTTGTITRCKATDGSGGALYVASGSGVNLNAGTKLTGNTASVDGGAVYSNANVILRGIVGGTEAGGGNMATRNGGGIFMGPRGVFTMYAGSEIRGNAAADGGGLWTQSSVRVAGGTLQGNSASGNGGALYAAEGAVVLISGVPSIAENEAKRGGAVYDGGSVTMTGGSMTANSASEKGGAVFVAKAKTFTMSGGSIQGGNRSPEGALSTGEDAILAFSGNVVVSGNTDSDGTTVKNVYLGYDSNAIITTSGLGSRANIGIYVADGEPEPVDKPDRVDNPIYADHGVGGRNFGTYTGSDIGSARLGKFVNDRDTTLNGRGGAQIAGSSQRYIMWNGKGMRLNVLVRAEDGTTTPAVGATFVLTNDEDVNVWSGRSDANGNVTIPWAAEEKAGGNVAVFAPKSTYTLKEESSSGNAVLPAGTWKVTVRRDNGLAWTVDSSSGEQVNRTIPIVAHEDPKTYLGDLFDLFNDIEPTITFNATGGKLADNTGNRKEVVDFTTVEVKHDYAIKEANPSWDSHVFKGWATMENKPTGDGGRELSQEELASLGYFEYARDDEIRFYRGAEEDKSTKAACKGSMTLYAIWDEVVCKVTDRDGNLLYANGSPAVYGSLEDCFNDYNDAGANYFKTSTGSRATARRIEMLIPTYTLDTALTLGHGKTVMLTTAPSTDKDGYAYTGDAGTSCVITRGETNAGSMITNKSNLTLMNIVLDGGGDSKAVVCDGGILNNGQSSAVLSVASGAVLRNSVVNGKGAAINVAAQTTLYLSGGTIADNTSMGEGHGAGIYLEENGKLYLSGSPYFKNNVGNADALAEGAQNGGQDYTAARQDIYLAGYESADEEDQSANSLVIYGEIGSGDGSIWVWADKSPRNRTFGQFAKVASGLNVTESSFKAFRNAQDDVTTGADKLGKYLYGVSKDGVNVCWYGLEGSRQAILRKVSTGHESLEGAVFDIYTNAARTALAKDAAGNPLSDLSSLANGVFYVGTLNYGTYYAFEKTAPSGYTSDCIFIITVSAEGVGYEYMEGDNPKISYEVRPEQ